MTTSPLARLMKRSPFKAMQEHMRAVISCVEHVPPLFEALIGGDTAGVEAAKDKIFMHLKMRWANKIKSLLLPSTTETYPVPGLAWVQ